MSSVYDLTHDPKYSDLVVLGAARELLAERGADTEPLERAIWSIKAETCENQARECETCDNTGRLLEIDPRTGHSVACHACDGSGYVVEADE